MVRLLRGPRRELALLLVTTVCDTKVGRLQPLYLRRLFFLNKIYDLRIANYVYSLLMDNASRRREKTCQSMEHAYDTPV
jgi:hypothetical protein